MATPEPIVLSDAARVGIGRPDGMTNRATAPAHSATRAHGAGGSDPEREAVPKASAITGRSAAPRCGEHDRKCAKQDRGGRAGEGLDSEREQAHGSAARGSAMCRRRTCMCTADLAQGCERRDDVTLHDLARGLPDQPFRQVR
jgi:hypothetical protein